jgi:hypothetical protein
LWTCLWWINCFFLHKSSNDLKFKSFELVHEQFMNMFNYCGEYLNKFKYCYFSWTCSWTVHEIVRTCKGKNLNWIPRKCVGRQGYEFMTAYDTIVSMGTEMISQYGKVKLASGYRMSPKFYCHSPLSKT